MQMTEIDWSQVSGVEIDPDRQSGSPVFTGTWVPVNVVTNNIHDGCTEAEIAEILENLSVTREQVDLVLGELRRHEGQPRIAIRLWTAPSSGQRKTRPSEFYLQSCYARPHTWWESAQRQVRQEVAQLG
jgi:uncharacterized protein (DUF433 family)